ncbi:MAG: DUF2232 domain-containing protein [Bdellovibrionota bacterium]
MNQRQESPPASSNITPRADGGASSSVEDKPRRSGRRRRKPVWPAWIKVSPYFLSGIFYLSAFFAVFAPLPLLVLGQKKSRGLLLLAICTNLVIVQIAGGFLSTVSYSIFVAVLALAMTEFLHRKMKIELIALYTGVAMGLAALAFLVAHATYHQQTPYFAFKTETRKLVDSMIETLSVYMGGKEASTVVPPETDIEVWKSTMVSEFPSAIGLFSLILIWVNLTLTLRINPEGIRERLGLKPTFLKEWKAPEFLVWPTILCGAVYIFSGGWGPIVALNILKVLLGVYAIQGLSLMSYFLDLWKIRGFLRSLAYMIVVFRLLPLVLGLGFFDLWFDFRAKFRQS